MLFNSYEFLLLFLPITLAGFFAIGARSQRLAAAWLALASLAFYAWWNPTYVLLLVGSICWNFYVGRAIAMAAMSGAQARARTLLTLGVSADLLLLGYYKYANFFLDIANSLSATHLNAGTILLPLGISFFTFTQIAFLVDAARGKVQEYRFVHYGLFVTYFPHLIAGPVLHHKEMMPQFEDAATYRPRFENFAVGLAILSAGLFKKTVLADGIAPYANTAFAAAASGSGPGLFDAWGGALAYTLQLYFDFSGYSDMAIGISRMVGIKLPLNFFSPYKAVNISDFWRRWHMTLSRFLRDYLYIALGGNRHGQARRYVNLLATMVLGGLWHGAGWTFVMWGALHGAYLCVNHAWQALRQRLAMPRIPGGIVAARALTFLCVVVGWVFFRATDFSSAVEVLHGMVGLNGASIPGALLSASSAIGRVAQQLGIEASGASGMNFILMYAWIATLLPVIFFLPNTAELLRNFTPALDYPPRGVQFSTRENHGRLAWAPSVRWGHVMALLFCASFLSLTRISEFLYYQF
jgi:alginate O-acetyltransferase complex protein AlgI